MGWFFQAAPDRQSGRSVGAAADGARAKVILDFGISIFDSRRPEAAR
jgi:hypothetical protein